MSYIGLTHQSDILGAVLNAIPPLVIIRHGLTSLLQARARNVSIGISTEERILHGFKGYLGRIVQAKDGGIAETEVDERFVRLALREIETGNDGSNLVLGSSL
jgi:hypothetical protein